MKKSYFITLLAAMLLMVPDAMAQKNKKKFKEADLKGIWQMCISVSESSSDRVSELKPTNTFKVLTDDGRITNFTVVPHKGAIITGTGTYFQASDTTYHENIERSIHLPMLDKKVNVLHFEMQEGQVMLIRYYIEKDQNNNILDCWYYETWKKVQMPDKYPAELLVNNAEEI